MDILTKTEKCYLLINNYKLQNVEKIVQDDTIVLDSNYKVSELKMSFKTGYEIKTEYSISNYGYGDSLIKYRELNDFSEDYQYVVNTLNKVKVNDYLFLPYLLTEDSKLNTKFNVTKYLYKGTYNYSIAKQKLISTLSLPSWFLFNSLLCGVPEHEEYNKQLTDYVAKSGYESVEDFRDDVISSNSFKMPSQIVITKGLLDILILSLTGQVKFESHLNVELLIDTNQYPNMTQHIIIFLNKYKIQFKLSNNIYKKDTSIKINSSFVYGILIDCFDSYSILNKLNTAQNKYLIKTLIPDYLISFSFATEVQALTLQHFFYKNNFLYNHQKLLSDFDNHKKYLLSPLSLDSYVKLDDGFLLPIKNILPIEDFLIEIHLQKTEA